MSTESVVCLVQDDTTLTWLAVRIFFTVTDALTLSLSLFYGHHDEI